MVRLSGAAVSQRRLCCQQEAGCGLNGRGVGVQKKRILQDVEYIKSESYIMLKRDLADTFKWFLVRSTPLPHVWCSTLRCAGPKA